MRMCFDFCHSHSVTCRLVTEPCETVFAPSTPHIYKSCTLLKQKGEKGTLIFVSRPNYAYKQLFLATLSSPSISDLQVEEIVTYNNIQEVRFVSTTASVCCWLY